MKITSLKTLLACAALTIINSASATVITIPTNGAFVLIGANGVGTLNHFYLWDIASITGNTTFAGHGSYNTQISGLSITGEGFNVFVKSLGLPTTGKNALAGVTAYGSIQSSIYARPVLVTEPHPWNWEPTGSVPEPSTYMYTMMGLALRRKAK